jgi:hypothetical protein
MKLIVNSEERKKMTLTVLHRFSFETLFDPVVGIRKIVV